MSGRAKHDLRVLYNVLIMACTKSASELHNCKVAEAKEAAKVGAAFPDEMRQGEEYCQSCREVALKHVGEQLNEAQVERFMQQVVDNYGDLLWQPGCLAGWLAGSLGRRVCARARWFVV